MRLADVASSTKTAAAAALALGGLLLTIGPALAEIRETTISKSEFVNRCQAMGGTVETGGTSNIKVCKLPNGQTVSCDFSTTSPTYCEVFRPSSASDSLLAVTPNSMTQDSGKPGLKLDLGGAGTIK